MRTICLYFAIHQPMLLRRYRFFDIGTDHYYYDDYANAAHISEVVERSYIPALCTLIDMVESGKGYFKVALSLSGVAAEQLEAHAPAVIDLLKKLNDTGCCEFLATPYSNGLAALKNEDVFRNQVARQVEKMEALFGVSPSVLVNTDLLYDDEIGAVVADMGFKGMLTEGAKHILGWKSPHYVYHSGVNQRLKLLLRDFNLSDDIALRFSDTSWSEYPLFADKFIQKMGQSPDKDQVINLFMELDALGVSQPLSSNILSFLQALPQYAKEKGIDFSTPTSIMKSWKSVSPIHVPYPITWNDEERDTSCWLGNVMQQEACGKLYELGDRVLMCHDRRVKLDFDLLQSANFFRDMTTKKSGVGDGRRRYDSPYDAFSNYMNILGDFSKRVESLYPSDVDNEELNALLATIRNQDAEIEKLHRELEKSREKLAGAKGTEVAKRAGKTAKTTKAAKG